MSLLSFPAHAAASIVLLLVGLASSFAHAQPVPDSTQPDTTDLGPRLERVLDAFGDQEQRAERAAEQLARLQAHPLNVNQASAADLSLLPALSARTAHRIVHHRDAHGPFKHRSDLKAVDGVTAETIRIVGPFLTVGAAREPSLFPSARTVVSNLELSVIQRYTRRLHRSRGYREGAFLGPPGRLTSRIRLDFERRLQLALTLDKDPGEPLRWSPGTDTYGFDHVAGGLTLRDVGPLKTLVVGDFTAQFGQGVALWQGLRFGKGRDPVSPALQSGRGILPYRSASEANYFRGVGARVGLPAGVSLTAFVSRRHRDASLDSSLARPDGGLLPVRTVSGGGRHRTASEIDRKGTFGERTVGGAVEHRSSSLHLGAAAYYSRFDRPLRPGDRPYRRFRVSGRHTSMLTAYGTAYLSDYTLFGELARSPTGTYGGLAGAALDGHENAQALLLARYYPATLANFYGSAFGESGQPQNEMGIYTGLRLRVAENWTLSAYVDQFRFPWLRFNLPRPTTGWEVRTVVRYAPRPWLTTYLQLRGERTEEATEYPMAHGGRIEGVQNEHRQSARLHAKYVFSDALTLRTRLEASRHSTPGTTGTGVLVSQGLRWTPHPRVQIDARLAFFDTDGYAARIYAYEHDLSYSFSVPVLFDQGRRSYVLIDYDVLPALTLEAKYGVTTYVNRTTVGSGLNEIQGSQRRGLRVQVKWTL